MDAGREAADNLLLQDAFALAKPILGICYGLQSLNVWRRGSLIQDLPQPPDATAGAAGSIVNHEPGREVQNAHPVRVTPGSRLSRLGPSADQEELRLSVNSSHHQAVDRPGEQLFVAAISPLDGVIEALEGAEPQQFVVAVQWHPERSYESSEASRALFAAFLDAARSWEPSRTTSIAASRS
jgi:putative glutamine amidotransferase